MSTRLEELFIELKLKAGDYLNEIAKVQKETTALAQQTGAGANNAGQLGQSLTQLGGRAERGAEGVSKINNALTNLATRAVGAEGPTGKLIEGLLLFGAGSGIVTGIALAITGIAAAIKLVGKEAAEAKKASDDLVESLRETLKINAQLTIDKAAKASEPLIAERDAIKRKLAGVTIGGNPDLGLTITQEAADKANARIKQIQDKLNELALASALAQADLDQFWRTYFDAGEGSGRGAGTTGAGTAAKLDTIIKLDQRIKELADPAALFNILALRTALQEIAAETEKLATAPVITTGGAKQLDAFQLGLKAQQVRLDSLIDNIFKGGKGGSGGSAETKKNVTEISQQIEQIGRGILGAAQAFGLLTDESAAFLQNILTAASSLPSALEGNISGIIGVAGGILGAIGSLLGESPEDRARQETLQRNTEALERVRAGLEQFAGDISGNQLRGTRQAALNIISRSFPGNGDSRSDAEILREAGVTWKEIQEVAESFGITLNGTIKSWVALNNAIAATDLTAFTKTFEGQRRAVDLQSQLFDFTDQQRLQALVDTAAGASPGLFGGLAGLDLTTAAGRKAAEDILQSIFAREKANQLTATGLGGLSVDQLNATLEDIEGLIDQINQASPLAENESFTLSRSITEVTGDRIASALATGNYYAKQTASTADTIVQLMEAGGIAVPGGSVVLTPAQIDRDLGDRARAAALRAGNTTVS